MVEEGGAPGGGKLKRSASVTCRTSKHPGTKTVRPAEDDRIRSGAADVGDRIDPGMDLRRAVRHVESCTWHSPIGRPAQGTEAPG